MAASNRLRWKRLLNELKFLHEEKELIESISAESGREFQIHYEEFCARQEIDRGALNQKHGQKIQDIYNTQTAEQGEPPLLAGLPALYEPPPSEEEESSYKMTKDEIEIYESFKKVFRKLALILHPDKLNPMLPPHERAEKLKMFKDAKESLEEHRYFKLLELADLFKINFPRNYKQHSRWMKREINRLEEEINVEKKTYNYQFAECETDAQKDRLIASFIYQLFGLQLSSK